MKLKLAKKVQKIKKSLVPSSEFKIRLSDLYLLLSQGTSINRISLFMFFYVMVCSFGFHFLFFYRRKKLDGIIYMSVICLLVLRTFLFNIQEIYSSI